MAGEERFSLFGGPTPTEVRQQINQARLEQDLRIAQTNPLAAPRINMMQGGRLFGDALRAGLGTERPEETRARKIQAAQQAVMNSGIDFQSNPQEYMKAAAKALRDQGLLNEAYQAMLKVREFDVEDVGIEKAESETSLNKSKSKYYDAQAATEAAGVANAYGVEFKDLPEVAQLTFILGSVTDPNQKKALEGRIRTLSTSDPQGWGEFKATIFAKAQQEVKSTGNISTETQKIIDEIKLVDGTNFGSMDALFGFGTPGFNPQEPSPVDGWGTE